MCITMADKPSSQNPAEIAREAFRQLAVRRIAPTPDAYHTIYDEIAGYAAQPSPADILARFAATLPDKAIAAIGKNLRDAASRSEERREGQEGESTGRNRG